MKKNQPDYTAPFEEMGEFEQEAMAKRLAQQDAEKREELSLPPDFGSAPERSRRGLFAILTVVLLWAATGARVAHYVLLLNGFFQDFEMYLTIYRIPYLLILASWLVLFLDVAGILLSTDSSGRRIWIGIAETVFLIIAAAPLAALGYGIFFDFSNVALLTETSWFSLLQKATWISGICVTLIRTISLAIPEIKR